jgi:hypothetical protein
MRFAGSGAVGATLSGAGATTGGAANSRRDTRSGGGSNSKTRGAGSETDIATACTASEAITAVPSRHSEAQETGLKRLWLIR